MSNQVGARPAKSGGAVPVASPKIAERLQCGSCWRWALPEKSPDAPAGAQTAKLRCPYCKAPWAPRAEA